MNLDDHALAARNVAADAEQLLRVATRLFKSVDAQRARIRDLEKELREARQQVVSVSLVPAIIKLQPKARAVLAILIKHSPDFIPRERFVFFVWEGREVADHCFNIVLMKLRRKLATFDIAISMVRGEGYALDRVNAAKIAALREQEQ